MTVSLGDKIKALANKYNAELKRLEAKDGRQMNMYDVALYLSKYKSAEFSPDEFNSAVLSNVDTMIEFDPHITYNGIQRLRNFCQSRAAELGRPQ